MTTRNVYFSMVITALFWSGAFIAGKMATAVFEPLTLTFWRFFLALPFIFLLLKFLEPEGILPVRNQILPLILLGIIGTFAYHFFFFLALNYTTAINTSLIGATNPMLTTLLGIVFFGEKITPLRLAGVGLSLFGVFSVITGLDPQVISTLELNQGDIFMILGVLCFSTYSLLSRKFMFKYKITPLSATAYTFLVCTIVSLSLSLWLENPLEAVRNAPGSVWWEILYMSVFASVLGYYFQLRAIHKIGAPKTAMFINLVPILTMLLAAVILREEVSLFKIACGLVIIFGVFLATRPEKGLS